MQVVGPPVRIALNHSAWWPIESGIVGWGRIGREVGRLARAFGMKISYFDVNRPSAAEEGAAEARYLPLDELLRTSDVVSIHASMTPQAFHLLSRERIALMKKNAILVNVARGPIVDESALADALEAGAIAGAGLDVYEREPAVEAKLLGMDNVVLLPHIGSATQDTREQMAVLAAKNAVAMARGKKPLTPVNPARALSLPASAAGTECRRGSTGCR